MDEHPAGFNYLSGGGQFMISNLLIADTPMLSILACTAADSGQTLCHW